MKKKVVYVKIISSPSTFKKVSRKEQPFNNCSGLKSIEVASGNSVFRSAGNCLIDVKAKLLLSGCKNSVIPSGKNIIGVKNAFNGCSSLERLVIPEGVEAVYGETFSGCTSLKAIVIPKSMRFGIDLDDCVNLESITLPKDKRELFKDLEGKVNFIETVE